MRRRELGGLGARLFFASGVGEGCDENAPRRVEVWRAADRLTRGLDRCVEFTEEETGGCSNARPPIRLRRERIEPLVDVGPR